MFQILQVNNPPSTPPIERSSMDTHGNIACLVQISYGYARTSIAAQPRPATETRLMTIGAITQTLCPSVVIPNMIFDLAHSLSVSAPQGSKKKTAVIVTKHPRHAHRHTCTPPPLTPGFIARPRPCVGCPYLYPALHVILLIHKFTTMCIAVARSETLIAIIQSVLPSIMPILVP